MPLLSWSSALDYLRRCPSRRPYVACLLNSPVGSTSRRDFSCHVSRRTQVLLSPEGSQPTHEPNTVSNGSPRGIRIPWSGEENQVSKRLPARITDTLDPLKRSKKRDLLRRTPSDNLIAALNLLGHHTAIPQRRPAKADLSYSGARSTRFLRYQQKLILLQPPSLEAVPDSLSLPDILARYLHYMHACSRPADEAYGGADDLLLQVFREDVVEHLAARNHTVEDVQTWAWILTAKNTLTAALRLIEVSRMKNSNPAAVPVFVLLFLLRREQVDAKSLRILLVHAWERLRGQPDPISAADTLAMASNSIHSVQESSRKWDKSRSDRIGVIPMNETTIVTMIVRLLRHARRVWPQSVVSITEMLSTYVIGTPGRLDPKVSSRLTFIYNRVLSLLAAPSSLSPFLTLPGYQRAQFNLIQRMTEFDPPLPLTQEGYRAVVRVQVAHSKTMQERQWEQKKARSWPPWKEERLGIDSEWSEADGVTRATEALSRMKEAGYAEGNWDKVATIFAGWDTDQSPTIQTRAFVRKVSARQDTATASIEESGEVWAARIRATRTLEEAWACFLMHEDQRLPRSSDMYYAMFEKLVFDSKRRRKERNNTSEKGCHESKDGGPAVIPGDGMEVLPPPTSPTEAVYNRIPPPNLMDLFERMVKEEVRPSERCLGFLVSHAASITQGTEFLQKSHCLGEDSLRALANAGHRSNVSQTAAVRAVPEKVFTAFIKLLCRVPSPKPPSTTRTDTEHETSGLELQQVSTVERAAKSRKTKPLLHALRLMRMYRPKYRPAWNAVLSAISRPGATIGSSDQYGNEHADILSWKLMREIVRHMKTWGLEIDVQTFHILCVGCEKAVLASLKTVSPQPAEVVAGREDLDHSWVIRSEAEEVLRTSPAYVSRSFEGLVGAGFATQASIPNDANEARLGQLPAAAIVPALLAVPGPAQLHAYIRVLGLLRDHEALAQLVEWMSRFALELNAIVQEARNGRRMRRRGLVAVRVFLERSWEERGEKGASEEVLAQVRDIVDGVGEWGGWPEDEEVEEYVSRGTFL